MVALEVLRFQVEVDLGVIAMNVYPIVLKAGLSDAV